MLIPIDRRDWMDDALCAQVGTNLHFPGKGESVVPAQKVCLECPVRTLCADYALDNRIMHGVWGALSETKRRDILLQRGVKLEELVA